MTQNNYPEGFDELANKVAVEDIWRASDFARALLDALAERGYVLVDAKKKEMAAGEVDRLKRRIAELENHIEDMRYTHPAIPGRVALPDGCKFCGGSGISKISDPCICQYGKETQAATTPPTQPQVDGSLRRDAQWINPNDKTQARYLPYIGELVLFCHGGLTYYGEHTGGSFRTGRGATARNFNTWECFWMYPPAAMEASNG